MIMDETVVSVAADDLAGEVRFRRDFLLCDTDWMFMVGDRPEPTNIQAWRDYRQALRDIPQQPGFPENIQWPTKPE
jgi:hypothetical protein